MDRFLTTKKTKSALSSTDKVNKPVQNILQESNDANIPENVGNTSSELRGNLSKVLEGFDIVKEKDNVKNEFQQLQFTETFPLKDYRLIEVDKKLAEEFRQGQKLVFRGDPNDFVVLCSESRSYAVKEVETSNSLLLLPELHLASEIAQGEYTLEIRNVNAISHHYLELKLIECASSFVLRDKLHENELDWDKNSSERKSYSFNDLLDIVQMSELELLNHLNVMPVVEHNGHLRWLSHRLRSNVALEIVSLCDNDRIDDVNVDKIVPEALLRNVSVNIPENVVEWFLKKCCIPVEDNVYKLNEEVLVRMLSSHLLRKVTSMDLAVFEQQLDELLPVGLRFQVDYLAGLAIVDQSFKGKSVSYLNIEDLPEDPRTRLQLLFEKKNTWTMDEVSPYLSDICSNAKSLSGLMVSHCRSTKNENNDKVFCGLKPV